MGAKYLPTKRDLKAGQRYRDNKHPLPHTRKSSTVLPKEKPLPDADSSKSDTGIEAGKSKQ